MSENKREIISDADQLPTRKVLHPAVEQVLANNPTPEALEKILNLQRNWEANEAKRAFTRALVELKGDLPAWIKRDKVVQFANVRYTHTSLASAMETVTPHLTKHGFSLTWKTANDKGAVLVTASLTHREGHAESCLLSAPPDTGGQKSAPQAVASTVTLLQRYTALSLLGLATSDMEDPKPAEPLTDQVDTARNMKAVAALKKLGKTKAQAEKHVGRKMQEWTGADLDKLREWITPKTSAAADLMKAHKLNEKQMVALAANTLDKPFGNLSDINEKHVEKLKALFDRVASDADKGENETILVMDPDELRFIEIPGVGEQIPGPGPKKSEEGTLF